MEDTHARPPGPYKEAAPGVGVHSKCALRQTNKAGSRALVFFACFAQGINTSCTLTFNLASVPHFLMLRHYSSFDKIICPFLFYFFNSLLESRRELFVHRDARIYLTHVPHAHPLLHIPAGQRPPGWPPCKQGGDGGTGGGLQGFNNPDILQILKFIIVFLIKAFRITVTRLCRRKIGVRSTGFIWIT